MPSKWNNQLQAAPASAPAPSVLADAQSLVSTAQVEKAVKALLAHHTSHVLKKKSKSTSAGVKKSQLPLNNDGDDDAMDVDASADADESAAVWLIVTTKTMADSLKIKPVKIPLRHPFMPSDAEICLFTKDPQKEYKALLEEHGVKVDKVIGISKLKTDYKPYEAKRQLCASYDMFLTDERVISVLPKLLGKTFFAKNKHPATVNLTAKNIKDEIESARNSTYLHMNKGTCSSIKVGTTRQPASAIINNLVHAIPYIVDKIPRKWSNILSILVKTSHSVSLPVYSALPDAVMPPSSKDEKEIAVVVPIGKEGKEIKEVGVSAASVSVTEAKGKGRKRVAAVEDEKEEEEVPKTKQQKEIVKVDVVEGQLKKKQKKSIDVIDVGQQINKKQKMRMEGDEERQEVKTKEGVSKIKANALMKKPVLATGAGKKRKTKA